MSKDVIEYKLINRKLEYDFDSYDQIAKLWQRWNGIKIKIYLYKKPL